MVEIDKETMRDNIFMVLAPQLELPKSKEAKFRKLCNLYREIHDYVFMAEIAAEESRRRILENVQRSLE